MEPIVVEVRYQGIVVGRGARARELSATGAFVETDAPMPVGSVVTIAPDGGPALRTRVARVTEIGEGRGMTLCWAGLADDARGFLATGLGAPPVDQEPGAAAPRGVPAAQASDGATERTDLKPPAGAVAEEVAPGDEISAPIDVGSPGADGGKRRGKRKRK